jgi:hypothetical protein
VREGRREGQRNRGTEGRREGEGERDRQRERERERERGASVHAYHTHIPT